MQLDATRTEARSTGGALSLKAFPDEAHWNLTSSQVLKYDKIARLVLKGRCDHQALVLLYAVLLGAFSSGMAFLNDQLYLSFNVLLLSVPDGRT